MNYDSPDHPSWNSRNLAQPLNYRVTMMHDGATQPPIGARAQGGVEFVQRRASDGDFRPWADPGARGTAVCVRGLLAHPNAKVQDARVFMTAQVFCRGAFFGAAKVVIVRGGAPMQWLDDVVSEAVTRTLEGLKEDNWRAILGRGIDHFPAWLASYALHRCQEGLRVLRAEIGDARWSPRMHRVAMAPRALDERPGQPGPRQDLFEVTIDVTDALASLSPEQLFVRERHEAGDTWEAIAKTLDCGIGAARGLDEKARAQLTRKLAKYA